MGNRAVITDKNKEIGVYVHWNGGLLSVTAFCTYCRLKEYRNPNNDDYGWARLCQVIGNFFGGSCSVGINKLDTLDTDNGDNGTYVIDENWHIVDRLYADWAIDETYKKEELLSFLLELDSRQPQHEQLGEQFIKDNYNK